MAKVTLYPTKIEQPNKNKSSGLAGVHFDEVRRDGKVHLKNLRDLNDPKYHHQWSNTSNLKEGKTAQCGHKSSYHCSHKTYYSIKGYRNTCPIAGVTGTYTQPATLRLSFSPKDKNIRADSEINSVTLKFKHRCVGVDVATDKIYTNWGPNFSGFSKYPGRKALTVKFGGETLVHNTNPPLSREKYGTVSLKFKNVSFKDLNEKSMDIIYGNNLSTNPGNIYITDLSLEVDYEDSKPYLEGKADTKTIYLSDENDCKSKIHFTLEAGYKQNGKKIAVKRFPKNLQKSVVAKKLPSGCRLEGNSLKPDTQNKKLVHAYLIDNSNTVGEKTVTFKLKENNQTLSFKYKAVKRGKPKISIPSKIERNVKLSVPSIIAKDGCTSKITIYDEGINGPSCELKLDKSSNNSSLDLTQTDNIVTEHGRDVFENWLSELSCGVHTLHIKFGNSTNDNLLKKTIEIVPTQYEFDFTYTENGVPIKFSSLRKDQNKTEGERTFPIKITLKNPTKYLNHPKFKIINPTYKEIRGPIGEEKWETGNEKVVQVGLYRFGNYTLLIKDTSNCPSKDTPLNIFIKSGHKQRFDTLFVRGEDSTAFDYTYLTALEGDTIKKPLYPTSIKIGNSFEDIKICSKRFIQTGLSETNFLELNITNKKQEAITNLLLELNTLTTDNEGNYTVTTDEWVEEDGIFKNMQEMFLAYNSNIIDKVTIKNLSLDDDLIDEEDVYLSISKLEPESTLKVKIPFRSHVEKDVDLQILLFGEPMKIYSSNSCSDEAQTFYKINFRVYDSIATEMFIEGDTDIQKPSETQCGVVCYKTENGVKYKITNIDTKSTDERLTTIIKNDPRLIAYKILDKNGNLVDKNNQNIRNDSGVKKESWIPLKNAKISGTVKFPEYSENKLTGYTNSEGVVTFYIKIPNSINKSFTSEDLEKLLTLSLKNTEEANIINTPFSYKPGQTVPLQFNVLYRLTRLVTEIIFHPEIKEAGSSDEITVFYRACGLPNNEGILKTTFKTATEEEVIGANQYELIPNEVSEDLLFGVKTDLRLYTKLEKIVVENKTINRLHLRLVNKKRFNKDINISFRENKNDLDKTGRYKYISSQVEIGSIFKDEENIINWSIPYLEKETEAIGFIDFEANEVGINEIDISVKDFLNEG